MNISKAGQLIQKAWRLAALLAVILTASGVRAEDNKQPGRFLLLFETSPTLKKNLPGIQQALAALFSSNLQSEMHAGDDIAVWTVDEQLHTGAYPLESWVPDAAEDYATRLNEFLAHQKYTRHATLAPIQPLLNRVSKSSERLTVLIFCDSQSALVGTPYDSGVNEIMTNAVARVKGTQSPFILVLRSYRGDYLGCSVNRSSPLNFPKFPEPPKPAPTPPPSVVITTTPIPPPVTAPVPGLPVTPVPALIIVGTNTSTNASDIPVKPSFSQSFPQPAVSNPATIPPPVRNPQPPVNTAPAPTPAPIVLTKPAVNSTPAPIQPTRVQPQPVPKPAPQAPPTISTPPPAVAATPPDATPAPSTETPSTAAPLVAETVPGDSGYMWPMILGGGMLVVAIGLVAWFMTRSKAPQGSLITSSMQDDPRLPPRK